MEFRKNLKSEIPARDGREDTMRRAVVILPLFLGLAGALGAQTQQGSWSNLTIKENGSDVSVKREDVVRVTTSSVPKRGEHALIGLVVGGAIGAGIGAASGSKTGFLGGSSRGICALVGIVIGAPSGAIVGAVLPANTTVYRATPAAPSH
jgi:hypothetical protein